MSLTRESCDLRYVWCELEFCSEFVSGVLSGGCVVCVICGSASQTSIKLLRDPPSVTSTVGVMFNSESIWSVEQARPNSIASILKQLIGMVINHYIGLCIARNCTISRRVISKKIPVDTNSLGWISLSHNAVIHRYVMSERGQCLLAELQPLLVMAGRSR